VFLSFGDRPSPIFAAPKAPKVPKVPNRLLWAALIWRAFLRNVLECARCKGRMEIVAALTSKAAITRVLGHLGLSADEPAFHPARPPPQTELPFADEAPDFVADVPAAEDFGRD
jgi:hypothetical protein